MAKGDFWTDEETALGRDLIKRKADKDEFFRIMGRTKASFFSHVGVKRRRERLDRAMKTGNFVSKHQAPLDLIEDAHRRLNASRTVTAAFFGDPPRGWSALDKLFTEGQHGQEA